jgi:hypothetical protein
MDRKRFKNWLKNIFETREEEISCSECFDLASRYVELEIAGQDAAAQMPELKQHLDQCHACRNEYETLRELRLLEEKGEFPSLDDLQNSIQ